MKTFTKVLALSLLTFEAMQCAQREKWLQDVKRPIAARKGDEITFIIAECPSSYLLPPSASNLTYAEIVKTESRGKDYACPDPNIPKSWGSGSRLHRQVYPDPQILYKITVKFTDNPNEQEPLKITTGTIFKSTEHIIYFTRNGR